MVIVSGLIFSSLVREGIRTRELFRIPNAHNKRTDLVDVDLIQGGQNGPGHVHHSGIHHQGDLVARAPGFGLDWSNRSGCARS